MCETSVRHALAPQDTKAAEDLTKYFCLVFVNAVQAQAVVIVKTSDIESFILHRHGGVGDIFKYMST